MEFLVVFPLLAGLLLFIGILGWYWWTQTTAATAIHDGVYVAAVQNGDRRLGYAVVHNTLHDALGGTADRFQGRYRILYCPQLRATWGSIGSLRQVEIPFLGRGVLGVGAMSFQRIERFYGGPAEDWE